MGDVSRASTRNTASGRIGPCPRGEGRSISAMSASPADVDRKIRQLDNEVQAIYEMLARIDGTQRRHDNRFAELGTDLTELRGQVSDLRADVTALDTKVTSLDAKVTSLDTKVTAIDTKVTSLDERVSSIDTKLDRVIGLLER
ncbi:hypothetical protein [Actinomycetospora sp. NBRC 106378]|uniref:hypothetical protein n=1 Tax=Actinomycetospora sp. NBRC 106378 TaxID=3032208 RepID=UPI00255567EC|nr:hypothetical protein [Actinomycetospora sp. NBRC 106378]